MLIGFPASASAATTLGQTFVPSSCSPETYIQTASPPSGPSYSAPVDGVITQWSYQSDSTPPPSVRLKVATNLGGGNLKIVSQSATETIAPSTLNTYSSRVSMPAGTDLGEFIDADCSRFDMTYTDFFADTDLAVGATALFEEETFQQDISAVLEPDADHDGFGDDTQDDCVGTAGQFNGCPSSFTLAKPAGKKGKVAVSLTVPGQGTLVVGSSSDPALASAAKSRTQVKPFSTTVTGKTSQQISVKLKLTKSARKALSSKGKLKVRIKAVYTPTGGPSASQTAKAKLKA
jgi:hypothetical protein